jgi:hypothetical protein
MKRTNVLDALIMLAAALILSWILFGCAKRVPQAQEVRQIVGEGFACTTRDEKTFNCVARDNLALDEALRAVGCGVCANEDLGTAHRIERIAK